MEVHIRLHLNIEGNKQRSEGMFPVNSKDFKEDPDMTVGIIAYEWIQKIKHQTGYRETEITQVVYNEEHDITELVRQIKPVIKDNLPF
ncbi:hypothetical protein [Peribacillus alkalitolerans]|uniref:hypothetical protein n=1 Tax=Peribacillus alkalitolerans TaxID=1550385 RepID=UPI001966D0EE|nr:hypothetical protein [Peribacillus alkalitolerans]